MDYTITDDISKATAWYAYFDEVSPIKNSIIPGKVYRLFKLKNELDEEYFILDEQGQYIMAYSTHNGVFIIEDVKGNVN